MKKISEALSHPFWASMAGSIVPTLISVGVAFYTYSYTAELQVRQVMNDLSSKFEESSGDVIDVSIAFVARLNENKDLAPLKEKISQSVARQIANSEKFRKIGNLGDAVDGYANALSEFNSITQSTRGAIDVKIWAETLDKVVSSRESLSQAIRGQTSKNI